MSASVSRAELLRFTVIARNYASDSMNRIHGPEAAGYGFAGGLVPGVGVYAYMTRAAAELWGRDWIELGAMQARFLKPVYDGDRIEVRAVRMHGDPTRHEQNRGGDGPENPLIIEAWNDSDILCAVGRAWMPAGTPPIRIEDYPWEAIPPWDSRREPAIRSLPAGLALGSRELELDLELARRTFIAEVCETLPIYFGPEGVIHPAFFPAQANYLLRDNINLGPWIHASSETRHFALPTTGELLSIRGRIAQSFEKRGNEYIVAELGIFGDEGRPIAGINHGAIVRIRRPDG